MKAAVPTPNQSNSQQGNTLPARLNQVHVSNSQEISLNRPNCMKIVIDIDNIENEEEQVEQKNFHLKRTEYEEDKKINTSNNILAERPRQVNRYSDASDVESMLKQLISDVPGARKHLHRRH